MLVNPFEVEGQWYKANLHCHTTVSDGDRSPAERVEDYASRGYHILALTDHRITSDVNGLSREGFLALRGIEGHPRFAGSVSKGPHHIVGLGVPEGFTLPDELSIHEAIARTKEAGGEVVYCHPYWTGHTINELLAVEGYFAIEIYSSISERIGKARSLVHWDELLNAGRMVGGLAVDDSHWDPWLYMGWTWIRAKELTSEAVMDSLRRGCYYSSRGPVIEDFHVEKGVARVQCSAAKMIRFIGQCENGRTYVADNEPLREAELALWPGFKYVRAEVVDEKGCSAWTNPIFL